MGGGSIFKLIKLAKKGVNIINKPRSKKLKAEKIKQAKETTKRREMLKTFREASKLRIWETGQELKSDRDYFFAQGGEYFQDVYSIILDNLIDALHEWVEDSADRNIGWNFHYNIEKNALELIDIIEDAIDTIGKENVAKAYLDVKTEPSYYDMMYDNENYEAWKKTLVNNINKYKLNNPYVLDEKGEDLYNIVEENSNYIDETKIDTLGLLGTVLDRL